MSDTTVKITAVDVVALVVGQSATLRIRKSAVAADNSAFVASAMGTARATLAGVTVSEIVAEIKSNRERAESAVKIAIESGADESKIAELKIAAADAKTELSVNSAIKYHALTGRVFILADGEIPAGYEPREIQTMIKTLTNGGFTRQAESAIAAAQSFDLAMIAIESLLVDKDARDAAKAASKIVKSGENGEDNGENGEIEPPVAKIKTAADLLAAMNNTASGLATLTLTADDATAARALADLLVKAANTVEIVKDESTVGTSVERKSPLIVIQRSPKSFGPVKTTAA